MVYQEVIENGTKRTLREFAEQAIKHIETHPECEEVVQLADNIVELEQDHMTRPQDVFELPERLQYYFSGFFGQVIGVGLPGLIH